MKKFRVPMLVVVALLGAAFALTLVGCAEEPDDVTGEMVDEVPEAAEEVYTDEPEEPGVEETPGVEVEEMETDTPPHVENGEADEDGAGEREANGAENAEPAPPPIE